jgi:predicted transglutaminase-like cysteine proteinase
MLRAKSALLAAVMMSGAMPAEARPLDISRLPQRPEVSAGQVAFAPLAYMKFCKTHADECLTEGEDVTLSADAATLALLDRVNRQTNTMIRAQARAATGLIDDWRINPAAGDCNDYAVSKRHALAAAGLPRGALRLAVARTSWGEGHLVLIARMADGDLVLDNLTQDLRQVSQTDYAWIKRESHLDPMKWEPMQVQTASRALSGRAVAAKSAPRARPVALRTGNDERRSQPADAVAQHQPRPLLDQVPARQHAAPHWLFGFGQGNGGGLDLERPQQAQPLFERQVLIPRWQFTVQPDGHQIASLRDPALAWRGIIGTHQQAQAVLPKPFQVALAPGERQQGEAMLRGTTE